MSALARRKEGNGEETYVGGEPAVAAHEAPVSCHGCWGASLAGWGGSKDDQSAFSGEGAGAFDAGGERIAINAMRMLAKTPAMANCAYEEQVTDVRERGRRSRRSVFVRIDQSPDKEVGAHSGGVLLSWRLEYVAVKLPCKRVGGLELEGDARLWY